jgi:hypothetical protein
MRQSLRGAGRYLVTPRVGVHRLFVWVNSPLLPDSATFVFARADDYLMGLLHSRIHEVWARSQATQVRERESGTRYTPRSCFETFPMPLSGDVERVAAAARNLNTLRARWLSPPEWTHQAVTRFPASVDGPWASLVENAGTEGIGFATYRRDVPNDEAAEKLWTRRTLTILYNESPPWLLDAHALLNNEVARIYGWEPTLSDEEILVKLLALNFERESCSDGEAEDDENDTAES